MISVICTSCSRGNTKGLMLIFLQDLPELEDVDVNEEQLITMAQQKKVRFLESLPFQNRQYTMEAGIFVGIKFQGTFFFQCIVIFLHIIINYHGFSNKTQKVIDICTGIVIWCLLAYIL